MISLIPFWIPLVWAIAAAIYFRFTFKAPVNHWGVCLIVFALNFFFFSYMCIAFLVIFVAKTLIGSQLSDNNKPNSKL
jgi:hypothetical protein